MNPLPTGMPRHSWLPWIILFGLCAILQWAGAYPQLRLDLPPSHGTWLYSVFTCHLVHLSLSHFLHNSLALLVLAWIFVYYYTWQNWLLTFFLSALSISVSLVLVHSGLRSYAGLSGVLHGFFTMGCLLLYPRQPRLAFVLLAMMSLKLLFEPYYGSLLMTTPGFTVASISHVYGVIGGLISWLCWSSICVLRARRIG